MAYTRATIIDPGPAGDTVKEAVLKNDTDLTNIFTHLNTHEGKVSTHGVAGDLVGTTDEQTLSNKTLTAPILNSPVLNTAVSGTAILDEDDLATDSATQLATQQSIKAYVDTRSAIVDAELDFFNGTFLESFDALVTSNGTVVTMSLEQSGGGDLTAVFSSGRVVLDCDPTPLTIALTAGDDNNPQVNYIYILESTGNLTKDTGQWPAAEHVKVAYFLVPSAVEVQAAGCYINQNWNDHRMGTNDQGHLAHLCEAIRLTMDGANWHSGVSPNGDDSTYIVTTGTPDEIYFKATAGVAFQMHKHTVPAWNMQTGSDLHVVNWFEDAYHSVADIASIIEDAEGVSVNNKYYNIVFWGTANKTGEYSPLMCNLSTGSYVRLADAILDSDQYDVTNIPAEFTKDSTIGFLICRLTLRKSGTDFTLYNTVDLRGVAAGASAGAGFGGGGGGGTDFADNVFTVYDSDDVTRILNFDLASITTGNTRTITPADADMTLLSTTDYTDLTDAGDTSLHKHDHMYYTETEIDNIITALGDTYYTETEIDNLLALYYTQTEIDTWRNSVTQTEMGYVAGVTSDIQTQLNTFTIEASIDHGSIAGLGDDDHTQYILHSLATAVSDFLIASGSGVFIKKTLAEAGAILEADLQHDNLQGVTANEHLPGIDEDDLTSDSDAHVPTQQSVKAYVDTVTVLMALADTAGDFLVATGDNVFVKKTLAETGAILEADINHDNLVGYESDEHFPALDEDNMVSDSDTSVATQQSIKKYVDDEIAALTTDHGELEGLDGDDHSQYLLTDGNRVLTGDWDAGAGAKILLTYLQAQNSSTNLQLISQDGNTFLNIRNGLADLQGGYMNIDKHLIITGDGSQPAWIQLKADLGGDNNDIWKIEVTDGGALMTFDSYSTGSYVTAFSISPAALGGALFKDEDDMSSNDDGAVASQQSIVAYIASELAAFSTDHGDLDGLSDDDHEQYILVAGTRAFTGVQQGKLSENMPEVIQQDAEPGTTYPGLVWVDTDADAAVHGTLIQDADGDTKIMTEESEDEDKIRFDTGGVERLVLDTTCKVVVPLDVRMANPLLRIIDTTVVSADDAQPLLYFMWGDTPTQLGYIGYGTPANSELYIYTNEALNVYTGGAKNLSVSVDGEVTKPLQPRFRIDNTAGLTNIAINTYHLIPFDAENFDVGSNFNSGTNRFTAPVAGCYYFEAQVYLQDWDANASYYILRIVAGGTDIRYILPGSALADNSDTISMYIGSHADMDANDTALVQLYQNGGAAQTDVSISGNYGFFAGHLIA